MNQRFTFIVLSIFLVVFGFHFSVFGEMTSTNFKIQWDNVSAGGDDVSTSSSYILRDSVDSSSASQSSSSSYSLDQGYRTGVYDRVADFEIFLENRSSQVAATSVSSTTISVTSTSGFTVGDMVALVQDEGINQVTAMGKILSISSPDIVVDEWRYISLMPTIDSSNDYLYPLNASSIVLAEPTASTVATSIIAWEVSADIDNGYSVYIFEDNGLTNGTDTFSDVSDGVVSVGFREYGARSSDTSLSGSDFDIQDESITTSLKQIGSRSMNSFSVRDFLTLKISADGSESSGSYSHAITVLYVGDY